MQVDGPGHHARAERIAFLTTARTFACSHFSPIS